MDRREDSGNWIVTLAGYYHIKDRRRRYSSVLAELRNIMQNPLRNLPSVNDLIERPPLKEMLGSVSRSVVVSGVRSFLDNLRRDIITTASDIKPPSPAELAEHIADWIYKAKAPPLRPVVNATGVLLHTGLGRAPLPEQALNTIVDIGRGYASVEVDVESGDRSHRIAAVEETLIELTGCEAAAVVNNNAAATMLTLTALAHGREVVVSRGELIEIGGSYRLPDVMTSAGAILKEVGTTNKTRIADYQTAIRPETGALLRVHTSNYMVVGFTERPTLKELVALSKKRRVPLIDDIGSGALIDLSQYGLKDEPIAKQSIAAGADLVLFSGDKLLGGPQCGIIVGRRDLVATINNHPMMRALRVDKITLAALAGTLELYRDPKTASQHIPLLSLLDTPLENLKHRAERLAPQIAASAAIESATAIEEQACLGGGSVPTQHIPTWAIAISPQKISVDQLAAKLRQESNVFSRVQKDQLVIDLRSVFPSQDMQIAEAFASLAPNENASEETKTEIASDDSRESATENE